MPELYAVSDMHLNEVARQCHDSALIESPTRLDRFLLNARVGEGFECDNNAISRLVIEAVLVEERTPQCQRRCVAVG